MKASTILTIRQALEFQFKIAKARSTEADARFGSELEILNRLYKDEDELYSHADALESCKVANKLDAEYMALKQALEDFNTHDWQ